jgi:molybdenum cofactor biosynthesis enzyme MoaA
MDLRAVLRSGANDGALKELLETALRVKPLEHQFRNQYQPCRPMTAIGG